jgi:hypothetical protein
MNPSSEIRIRTRISPEELESKKGKILSSSDLDLLMVGPTTVRRADGKLLCIYLPSVLSPMVVEGSYGILHELRRAETSNRGLASGGSREKLYAEGAHEYAPNVASAIIGSFDPGGHFRYCRLTAWSGREWDKYATLFPLFQEIGRHLAERVPDRYAAQMEYVARTHPDWVIPDTPFTTITVNNSYPTGVHTDAGDLDEGFSTLAVIRRGDYSGGIFTFPEYRLGVDMQDGDLLLMDAHEWHGNTYMECNECGRAMGARRQGAPILDHSEHGVERISIVCYYRTKMKECGSMEEEQIRGVADGERRGGVFNTVDEMAREAVGG